MGNALDLDHTFGVRAKSIKNNFICKKPEIEVYFGIFVVKLDKNNEATII